MYRTRGLRKGDAVVKVPHVKTDARSCKTADVWMLSVGIRAKTEFEGRLLLGPKTR